MAHGIDIVDPQRFSGGESPVATNGRISIKMFPTYAPAISL
jgi:hypothetical protein